MAKACLLAYIHQDLPCLRGSETQLGLFAHTTSLDADEQSMPSCLAAAAARSLDANWLLSAPGRTLLKHLAANLRYRTAYEPTAVIFAAVEEALRHGPAYTLCGIGAASRLLLSRTKAVSHEVHRMLGFIRFQPIPDTLTLVAKPKLFHDTADLILRQFAPRYPQHTLILIEHDHALKLTKGTLQREAAADYLCYTTGDDFTQAWETYYQSQYIATRKNDRLASKVIPKRYWDWLTEGKFLRAAATETTTSNTTTDTNA